MQLTYILQKVPYIHDKYLQEHGEFLGYNFIVTYNIVTLFLHISDVDANSYVANIKFFLAHMLQIIKWTKLTNEDN